MECEGVGEGKGDGISSRYKLRVCGVSDVSALCVRSQCMWLVRRVCVPARAGAWSMACVRYVCGMCLVCVCTRARTMFSRWGKAER